MISVWVFGVARFISVGSEHEKNIGFFLRQKQVSQIRAVLDGLTEGEKVHRLVS